MRPCLAFKDAIAIAEGAILRAELFEGKAMCSLCHISEVGPDELLPLFTDYAFDNLGVPQNPENPAG